MKHKLQIKLLYTTMNYIQNTEYLKANTEAHAYSQEITASILMHFRGPSHKRSASTSGVSRGGQSGGIWRKFWKEGKNKEKGRGRGKRGGKKTDRQGKREKENKEEKREIVKGEE